MATTLRMRIERVFIETPDIRIVRLIPIDAQLFAFLPGQFVMLNLKDAHGIVKRRSYSIASSPITPDHLELCIKIKQGGETGNIIEGFSAGIELLVEGPYGRFTPDLKDAPTEHLVLIGTGSGITPLMSIVRTIAQGCANTKATLIYGIRHPRDYAYRTELSALASPRIAIIPVVSNPDSSWDGAQGHVQDIMKDLPVSDTDTTWFLCGPRDMVLEVIALLHARGIPDDRIKREMYG